MSSIPITSRVAEVAFWVGIVLWISAILTAGVSAAMAFPTMHEYEVFVPKFNAYNQAEHWTIAAGLLMERMFFVTDIAQLVMAPVALLGLGVSYSTSLRSLKNPMEVLRTLCVVAAALLLAYRVFLLAPEMNHALHGFWNAAEQGSTDVAIKFRNEFQAMHPIASRVYGIMLVLLLGAVATTAWSPPTPLRLPAALTGGLEEPALARKGRS